MANYNITIFCSEESGIVYLSWSGVGGSNSAGAQELNRGDTLSFKKAGYPSETVTLSGFDSGVWTSTSDLTLTTSYQTKTVSSSATINLVDSLTAGCLSHTLNRYFKVVIVYLNPDITIADIASQEVTATNASHTISIASSGTDTNASITHYRSTANTGTTRIGHGDLTVVPSTNPPTGIPQTYCIEGMIPTADDGRGVWADTSTCYGFTRITANATNDPTIDAYGLAIYDQSGTAVTSFTAGHTVLRNIFASSSFNTSTTSYVDVATSLTGLTNDNCVINIKGVSSGSGNEEFSRNLATSIVSGTTVRVARVPSAYSAKVTVLQHTGSTIGASANNYGLSIINGDNNLVIDDAAEVYAVKEIIQLPSSAGTVYTQYGNLVKFVVIELTESAYPASGGIPIPAIHCSNFNILIPPRVYGAWGDGSYKYVSVTLPGGATTSSYYIAMLVPSSTTTPSYYGGSASGYGVEIKSPTSPYPTLWSSEWRQAIINNIVDANQFTTGTNQDGNYDILTGYDGVTAPLALTNNTPAGTGAHVEVLTSTSEVKSVTGLNEMDPSNTYLLGSCISGRVVYNAGDIVDYEHNTEQLGFGGGFHVPAATVTSSSSINITMFRIGQGIRDDDARCERVATSHHPEGHFVFARIV